MKSSRGFTLLEILLVVAAIAILSGIVIVAINPVKQLAETRNAQRRSDVAAISSAMSQYLMKHASYPDLVEAGMCEDAEPDSSDYAICRTGANCGGIRLDRDFVPDYLPDIPVDPSATNENFSGYTIAVLSTGRIIVCAPLTEVEDYMISATR